MRFDMRFMRVKEVKCRGHNGIQTQISRITQIKKKNTLNDKWNFIGSQFFPMGPNSIEIATQKRNTNPAISLGSLSPWPSQAWPVLNVHTNCPPGAEWTTFQSALEPAATAFNTFRASLVPTKTALSLSLHQFPIPVGHNILKRFFFLMLLLLLNHFKRFSNSKILLRYFHSNDFQLKNVSFRLKSFFYNLGKKLTMNGSQLISIPPFPPWPVILNKSGKRFYFHLILTVYLSVYKYTRRYF